MPKSTKVKGNVNTNNKEIRLRIKLIKKSNVELEEKLMSLKKEIETYKNLIKEKRKKLKEANNTNLSAEIQK